MGGGFPVEAWKGKRNLYVLGGIGSVACGGARTHRRAARRPFAQEPTRVV